jgi:hypothetical protein
VITLTVVGLTETETGGGMIVSTVEAEAVESALLVALIVTVFGLGTDAGAL